MLDRPSLSRRDRLIALVHDILRDNAFARPDHIAVNLREAGLTSLDLVKLVLGIEREFGVIIDADDFDPGNFETIDALQHLVDRRTA